MTVMQQVNASSSPEVQMNENFETLEHQAVYGKNHQTTTGLTWGYYGGRWGGTSISNGTLSLTGGGSPTGVNYIVVNRATGAISVSTASTNWDNVAEYARVYKIHAGASAVEVVEDHRAGPHGVHGTRAPLTWNQQSGASYTLALTDAENAVAMSSASANTLTVPANATVAFPVGTQILVHQEGAGQTTIAAAGGVSIRRYSSSSPTVYTLAGQFALARLVKRATNEWVLSGDLST